MVESREEALGSEMLCEELSGELCAQLKAIEASKSVARASGINNNNNGIHGPS